MTPFTYNANPARVIFGSGTLSQLPAEVERLGLERVLVLATPQQEADARDWPPASVQRSAGVYANATMHTPVSVTEDAMRVVAERRVDGLVAVGGGSTTGLAKGDRATHRPAADHRTDDLRGIGDDPDPRRDARRPEGHADKPQGPARGGDLRRRSDADPAAGDLGHQRDQRDRPRGGSALRARPQSR